MDNEIIFKVSQAIRSTPNASDYDTIVSINAIKALIEPTDKMLTAGAKMLPDYEPSNDDAKECWQEMIKAILE